MPRPLLAATLILGLQACEDPSKPGDDGAVDEQEGLSFWPPEAGRDQTFEARITSGSSVFDFEGNGLEIADGVTVNSFTVLDGWTATASVTVAADAILGPRDAEVTTERGTLTIDDALTIVDDSFTVTPDRARIGESVEVELQGVNTAWTSGSTWAGFGDDIEVVSVDVLSETYAVATIHVDQEAAPGLRDVSMQTGPEITTLYNGFTVDRVALSATFEPDTAAQGQTVEFTVRGSGTHFDEDSELSFWSSGLENGDIVIDSVTVIDAENLWGRMTVSNAAELGLRDVLVTTGTEGVFIGDAFEVTGGDIDLSDVAISLWFNVVRGIDNTTGAIAESVSGGAIFYIPLDPACPNSPESYACTDEVDNDGDGFTDCYDNDCSSSPACAAGPQPYDANGVFGTYVTGGSTDCPTPVTVGAGDHVWFESDCNIVTLERMVDASSGMIYYSAALTLDDYCFDQLYDLHTEGEDGGIGEYVLDQVQPTVPADFSLVAPELWNDFTWSRAQDFTYQWTPAQTYGHYPEAYFITNISGLLEETGEPGFVGAIPWDDGEHTYTAEELSALQAGNVTFSAYSLIPEGPEFGFPFSTIQSNKSSTYVYLTASMVLE